MISAGSKGSPSARLLESASCPRADALRPSADIGL
jgi:hypothetical protein